MEPILRCLFTRGRYNEYSYLEWTINANLQLQRLAHEGLDQCEWAGCDEEVPVTSGKELLRPLNINDLAHPTLSKPVPVSEAETEGSTLYTAEESVPTAQSIISTDAGPDSNRQLPDEGTSSTLGPNRNGGGGTRLDGTVVSDMNGAGETSRGNESAQGSASVASRAVTRAHTN